MHWPRTVHERWDKKNKKRFHAKGRVAELVPSDRVLVWNVNIRGKHKLANKWEHTICVVVKNIADGQVYVVKKEKKEGPLRTLHRDLLLHCRFVLDICE